MSISNIFINEAKLKKINRLLVLNHENIITIVDKEINKDYILNLKLNFNIKFNYGEMIVSPLKNSSKKLELRVGSISSIHFKSVRSRIKFVDSVFDRDLKVTCLDSNLSLSNLSKYEFYMYCVNSSVNFKNKYFIKKLLLSLKRNSVASFGYGFIEDMYAEVGSKKPEDLSKLSSYNGSFIKDLELSILNEENEKAFHINFASVININGSIESGTVDFAKEIRSYLNEYLLSEPLREKHLNKMEKYEFENEALEAIRGIDDNSLNLAVINARANGSLLMPPSIHIYQKEIKKIAMEIDKKNFYESEVDKIRLKFKKSLSKIEKSKQDKLIEVIKNEYSKKSVNTMNRKGLIIHINKIFSKSDLIESESRDSDIEKLLVVLEKEYPTDFIYDTNRKNLIESIKKILKTRHNLTGVKLSNLKKLIYLFDIEEGDVYII